MRLIQTNLRPKILKNALFIRAVDYLIEKKIVDNQKHLCEVTKISEATISNVRNDKKIVSDKTIYKLTNFFPDIFNMAYFRGESMHMLLEDVLEEQIDQNRKKLEQEKVQL